MHSILILLGILFGLLTQAHTLPVKVSTKRKYDKENAPFYSCHALKPKLYYNAPLCYRILQQYTRQK